MNLRHKLLRRIAGFARTMILRYGKRQGNRIAIPEHTLNSLRVRYQDREQWRRWHQANQRRWRQLRAYKRLGMKLTGASSLHRWMVN